MARSISTSFALLIVWVSAVLGFKVRTVHYLSTTSSCLKMRRYDTSTHASRNNYCSITSNENILSIRGGEVQTITSLEEVETIIEEARETTQLVVLDFAANNCPPCEMIRPIYEDMSNLEEFRGVKFLKVNVSDHPDVADKYGVDGWPTFLLFRNGNKIDSVVGGQAAKTGLYTLVAKNMV